MSLTEEIKSIETPSKRDLSWYYHCIPNHSDNDDVIKNILSEGIKCRNLLGQEGVGCNGEYFISLSKDIGAVGDISEIHPSAFHFFRSWGANIIIDGIKARKCLDIYFLHLLANTKFPIRPSEYQDEFQFYGIIEPDKFIGIQYPLYQLAYLYEKYGYNKDLLDHLKNLIFVMKLLESKLPLYDYSRLQGTSVHQINPDEFLAIYDGAIGELTSEEKHILQKRRK